MFKVVPSVRTTAGIIRFWSYTPWEVLPLTDRPPRNSFVGGSSNVCCSAALSAGRGCLWASTMQAEMSGAEEAVVAVVEAFAHEEEDEELEACRSLCMSLLSVPVAVAFVVLLEAPGVALPVLAEAAAEDDPQLTARPAMESAHRG